MKTFFSCLGISGLFVLVFSFPFVWQRCDSFNVCAPWDLQILDAYGSYLGGLLGTWAAIAGVVFVYNQYKNDQKSKEKDNIESRFFQLLNLHNKNVERIEAYRPNAFAEYKKILMSILEEVKKNWDENSARDEKEVFKLSYLYFFYGFQNMKDQPLTFSTITEEDVKRINDKLQIKKLSYPGVYLELGIYFRQLYQIVNFINEKTILSYKEKYNYIHLLRVQLNVYEQYMLFLNSMSSLGKGWEQEEKNKPEAEQDCNKFLITKYNLIANIPNNFKQIKPFRFQEEYENVVYEYNDKERTELRKELDKKFN